MEIVIDMNPVQKASSLLLVSALICLGADALTYQKPPKAILDVLNSPTTPVWSLNASRTYAAQGAPVRNPPIAELARPMLRLAGLRIDPQTNGLHNTIFNASLTLRKIPEGTEIKVNLPPDPKLGTNHWSPNGPTSRLRISPAARLICGLAIRLPARLTRSRVSISTA
jgi:hypothetical protein